MPVPSSHCRLLCTYFPGHRFRLPAGGFSSGTAIIHAFYFTLLAQAYEHGDLSVVYPLARGVGVALTPIGAVLFLGEHISLPQGLGIAGIVLGLLILQIPADLSRASLVAHFRPAAGIGFAVVTGMTIATYSLWDKVGVSHVPPLLYVTGAFLGPAIALSWLLRRRVDSLVAAWRAHPVTMGAGAVLSPLAYSLALVALSIAQVSQVAPLREVGVVIGTVLGIIVSARAISGAAHRRRNSDRLGGYRARVQQRDILVANIVIRLDQRQLVLRQGLRAALSTNGLLALPFALSLSKGRSPKSHESMKNVIQSSSNSSSLC